MKLSKSNIKIILFIVAVAILGLTYLYVFKDNMSTADSIQSEVDTLQARYDELNAKQKDRDMRKRLLNMKSFLLTDWHISLQHWIRKFLLCSSKVLKRMRGIYSLV